jgi:hypothetical protein
VEIWTSSNYILQSHSHALSYNLRNDYDIEISRKLDLFCPQTSFSFTFFSWLMGQVLTFLYQPSPNVILWINEMVATSSMHHPHKLIFICHLFSSLSLSLSLSIYRYIYIYKEKKNSKLEAGLAVTLQPPGSVPSGRWSTLIFVFLNVFKYFAHQNDANFISMNSLLTKKFY